ncbi:DUF2267 domain-containing protein [Roseibium aestuarii]|uniref:DUF2267 domain-containing protein n=1 Tax=Roseibium aestuarii TaxID=2600299 RepID=A0ABW4JTR2_9HYPH|nr:DUF2267 domain-containing protein [Roseibium aestuarii]
MEDLIQHIVATTGIDEDAARKGVTIILNFLNKEAPAERMQEVFDALPGTREAVTEYLATKSSGKGLFGGLAGMVPGMGAMAVLGELNSAGLEMADVQRIIKRLVGVAREKAGDEAVDEVISSIPILKQIL